MKKNLMGNDKKNSSYGRILRSTSIIGGASVINILIGLVRMKAVALLLGPAGVGLIGLMQSLISTGAAVAALGLGTAGTRQIAKATAQGDNDSITSIRHALFIGTLLLALGGAVIFWITRNMLAVHVLNNPVLADDVGWLAFGVALTVASGSQGALLNGLQRIEDLARVSIGTAIISTIFGVAVLFMFGEQGLIFFVLGTPIASFLLGHWYVAKLPKLKGDFTRLSLIFQEWKVLARLGVTLMFTGVMWSISHLFVRTYIENKLGSNELGHFQAAWTIGTTYLGFVLGALGTDFYPRLSAVMDDHDQANRLINEQSEVGLLLTGPILLAMLGVAPWVIELLYSSDFIGGADLLQWQILGDVLKVVIWPLSYSILAAGNGRAHFITESLSILIFVMVTWFLLPSLGIKAAGISFFMIFVVLLPITYLIARRRTGFRWTSVVLFQMVLLMLLAIGVFLAGAWSKWLGAGFGIFFSLILALYGLARLGHMANLSGPLGQISDKSRELMIVVGVWRE